jgi:hypothetical protein
MPTQLSVHSLDEIFQLSPPFGDRHVRLINKPTTNYESPTHGATEGLNFLYIPPNELQNDYTRQGGRSRPTLYAKPLFPEQP